MNVIRSYRLFTRMQMVKEKRSPKIPRSTRELRERSYDREIVLDHSGNPAGDNKKGPYIDVSTRIPQVPSPRRAQEENDGRILFEDMNAVGNMPREAIHEEFNKYHPERLLGED